MQVAQFVGRDGHGGDNRAVIANDELATGVVTENTIRIIAVGVRGAFAGDDVAQENIIGAVISE